VRASLLLPAASAYIAPAPYHNRYSADAVPSPARPADRAQEGAQHPWLRSSSPL